MARAYRDDLRRKLLEAHAAGKGTLGELAERFGVSLPWAWKVSAAHKRSGAVERAPQSRHGRASRVDRARVRALLKANQAAERDTEENRQRREVFLDRLRSISTERLILLDESGVSTQMTRRYARAERGVRVHESTPEGNWKILTILSAMSLDGMIATMTIEVATDAEIFLASLSHVLCPALRPGDVAIMDNLSSHKVSGVRELIEAAGAELLYLPPYSPDLNPIEKAWAKLKQLLRTAKARTAEALEQAIADHLPDISPRTLRHASEHHFILYSYEEYALKRRLNLAHVHTEMRYAKLCD